VTDFEAQIAELQRALADKDAKLANKDAKLAAAEAKLSAQRAVAARLGKDAQDKAAKILELQHRLDLLARQLFGRKAERVDPNQLKLAFDQASEEGEAPPPFVDEAPGEETGARAARPLLVDRQSGKVWPDDALLAGGAGVFDADVLDDFKLAGW